MNKKHSIIKEHDSEDYREMIECLKKTSSHNRVRIMENFVIKNKFINII